MKLIHIRRHTLLIGAALLTLPALLPAAIIDNFQFTQNGYNSLNEVTGTVTGSFSGTVESSGLIEAADLTGFSAQFTSPFSEFDASYSSLDAVDGSPFFSYNVNGGASSLDFVALGPVFGSSEANLCEGAAATLFCSAPASSTGYVVGAAYTPDQPTVTLVSSAAPVPVPPTPVPEPAGLAVVGLGCVLAGTCRFGKRPTEETRTTAAASSAPSKVLASSFCRLVARIRALCATE